MASTTFTKLSHLRHILRYTTFEYANRPLTLCTCSHLKKLTRRYSTSRPGNNDVKVQEPTLKDFISLNNVRAVNNAHLTEAPPYTTIEDHSGEGRKVYLETYGCQMNVNDTEIAWSILQENGFQKTDNIKESDVILLMTCSIREGAEQKIWNRLEYLKSLKKHRRSNLPSLKLGILGCMAERLKHKILDKEKMVDVICGPDAYRDLPRMLSVTESGQAAVNVLLSLEETYADVMPVRMSDTSPSAFVSIMRGCDNMCSYCIVPFTRGRERSRPIDSIVEEVTMLSDQGVKEVTLLGQNVNSYRDTTKLTSRLADPDTSLQTTKLTSRLADPDTSLQTTKLSRGFGTVYKSKKGGMRFGELLDRVSMVDPDMRIRFTSPHPKDFPDEVLTLIKERPNICNQIHLPAQSGSTSVLERMRREYTREAYIDLVHHIRDILPDVSLSSDFIAGFCGETEEDHQQTLSLIKLVKYNFAFCFPYSMRQKTRAHHRMTDDVTDDVKSRRHMELVDVFRQESVKLNRSQVGQHQLVLVEGTSKRSRSDLAGRNDGNTKVIFPSQDLPSYEDHQHSRSILPGDYVVVEITGGTSQTLLGKPLYHSTLKDYSCAIKDSLAKVEMCS